MIKLIIPQFLLLQKPLQIAVFSLMLTNVTKIKHAEIH